MDINSNLSPDMPIGVFDSGVGGLTVAREIMRQLPYERLVYFGDTARVPYGSKSKQTIIGFSRQIIRFLKTKNVKAIVIACNTATALALDTVQEELDIPIIGVIRPGAAMAAAATQNNKIGVIATESTIESGLYGRLIRELNPRAQVLGKACPLFVPLVEEGWRHDPITEEVANRYLEPLKETGIDTLIMGCTHYPLLRSTLRKVMGDSVTLVNPAYETAICLKQMLEELELANNGEAAGDGPMYEFYVSDSATRFRTFANSILPYEVEDTRQVDIEQY